jgi:hypothetical protein
LFRFGTRLFFVIPLKGLVLPLVGIGRAENLPRGFGEVRLKRLNNVAVGTPAYRYCRSVVPLQNGTRFQQPVHNAAALRRGFEQYFKIGQNITLSEKYPPCSELGQGNTYQLK